VVRFKKGGGGGRKQRKQERRGKRGVVSLARGSESCWGTEIKIVASIEGDGG